MSIIQQLFTAHWKEGNAFSTEFIEILDKFLKIVAFSMFTNFLEKEIAAPPFYDICYSLG